MAWSLQFLGYLRTLSLKFQKTTSKIEAFLALLCWLFQVSWNSQQGRARKTSILILAFWNFKLQVLKHPRNCRLHATLILNLTKPPIYIVCFHFVSTFHILKRKTHWKLSELSNFKLSIKRLWQTFFGGFLLVSKTIPRFLTLQVQNCFL